MLQPGDVCLVEITRKTWSLSRLGIWAGQKIRYPLDSNDYLIHACVCVSTHPVTMVGMAAPGIEFDKLPPGETVRVFRAKDVALAKKIQEIALCWAHLSHTRYSIINCIRSVLPHAVASIDPKLLEELEGYYGKALPTDRHMMCVQLVIDIIDLAIDKLGLRETVGLLKLTDLTTPVRFYEFLEANAEIFVDVGEKAIGVKTHLSELQPLTDFQQEVENLAAESEQPNEYVVVQRRL